MAETPTVEPVETAPEVGYEQPAVAETPAVAPVETAPEVGYEQPAVAEAPAVETVESTPQESYEAPVNTDAPVGLETPGAPISQEVNETPVEPTTQMQDSNSQTESQSVATTQEPKKNNI